MSSLVPSPLLSDVQFALYEPCSNDDDYDDGSNNNILFFMGAVTVRKDGGCGVCIVPWLLFCCSVTSKYLLALLLVLIPT